MPHILQGFAKNLLDVADNVRRALMTVPEEVQKGLATDQSETGKLLHSLLEGLMLTEKELMKVIRSHILSDRKIMEKMQWYCLLVNFQEVWDS